MPTIKQSVNVLLTINKAHITLQRNIDCRSDLDGLKHNHPYIITYIKLSNDTRNKVLHVYK